MIEVADVFRRFAADYLSAHGSRCCHRIGAPSRTSSTAAPRRSAARCGAARPVTPRCSPITHVTTEVARSATPSRRKNGSNTGRRNFHITVTVPAELREVLRAHQRDGYAVLMQATAAAIIELARD